MSRHIAMWSCPRSCSTVITRAFEQLPGCFVFDEPFYAPYLLTNGLNHPHREEIFNNVESDYRAIIPQITGELPNGAKFSFQKQMAKHVLPEFKGDWLYSLENFFLIRDLRKILASYQKVYGETSGYSIGIKALYDIFHEVKSHIGKAPIVISADDLLKNPEVNFPILCDKLKLQFSPQMLTWERGLKNSNLLGVVAPQYGRTWYGNVMKSQGFTPQTDKVIDLSIELETLFNEAEPYYKELYKYRVQFPSPLKVETD